MGLAEQLEEAKQKLELVKKELSFYKRDAARDYNEVLAKCALLRRQLGSRVAAQARGKEQGAAARARAKAVGSKGGPEDHVDEDGLVDSSSEEEEEEEADEATVRMSKQRAHYVVSVSVIAVASGFFS